MSSGLFQEMNASSDRCEEIVRREGYTEIGLVLKAALADGTLHVTRDWYLYRLDNAVRIQARTPDWTPLKELFPRHASELERFEFVIGLEPEVLAIDHQGSWLVSSEFTVKMLVSERESERYRKEGSREDVRLWMWIAAIFLVVVVILAG